MSYSQDGCMASPEDLRDLKSSGYFVRKEFFTLEEMIELERITDASVEVYDKVGAGAAVDPISKKNKITFVNSMRDDSQAAESLLDFALSSKVGTFARSIEGPGAMLFAYQIIYKFPHNPDPFPWHQDDNYVRSSKGYTTLWVAIRDVTAASGCVRVLPGQDLDLIRPAEQTEWGMSCWPLDDPNQGIPVELKRGSLVAFSSRLPHMSGGNMTDDTRKAIIFAIMDRDCLSSGQKPDLKPFRD